MSRNRPRLDVVIPAGGAIDGEYRTLAGTSHRSLARVGKLKTPVLQHVIDALRYSDSAGKIIVVGDLSVSTEITGYDEWLPEAHDERPDQPSGGPANILRGLALLPGNRPAVVCTSDLPFLTGGGVAAFIERVDLETEAISMAIVPAKSFVDQYPDAPPSEFVTLSDTGPITLACIFCVVPDILRRNTRVLDQAFGARKSQWRMASLLGPALTWQFARKRLSLAAIRRRAEQMLQCRTEVMLDAPPELAFDIDTAEDYAYAAERA